MVDSLVSVLMIRKTSHIFFGFFPPTVQVVHMFTSTHIFLQETECCEQTTMDLPSSLFREAPNTGNKGLFAYLGRYSLSMSSYFANREGRDDPLQRNHKRQGHQIKLEGCILHTGSQPKG